MQPIRGGLVAGSASRAPDTPEMFPSLGMIPPCLCVFGLSVQRKDGQPRTRLKANKL